MDPLTPDDLRAAMANCSKGEAKRLNPPADLASTPWEQTELLGWRDPKAPQKAYLVAPYDGGVVGLVLRTPDRVSGRPVMCDLCRTTHSAGGVALLVAPRPGARGREGDTVGTYLCTDLRCSHYARRTTATAQVRPAPGLEPQERVAQLAERVTAFVGRVLG